MGEYAEMAFGGTLGDKKSLYYTNAPRDMSACSGSPPVCPGGAAAGAPGAYGETTTTTTTTTAAATTTTAAGNATTTAGNGTDSSALAVGAASALGALVLI